MAYASWSVVFGEQPSAAKWNILGTNDASFNDGTGIGASAITPEKLLTGNGTTWVWQNFTPSLTNWTIGTGGSAGTTAKYIKIGTTVVTRIKSTLGTSGQSVSGEPTFNLPVTAASHHANFDTVNVVRLQAAATGYTGYFRLISTTQAKLLPMVASGTYVSDGTISNTTPNTWAAGDLFSGVFIYEAA